MLMSAWKLRNSVCVDPSCMDNAGGHSALCRDHAAGVKTRTQYCVACHQPLFRGKVANIAGHCYTCAAGAKTAVSSVQTATLPMPTVPTGRIPAQSSNCINCDRRKRAPGKRICAVCDAAAQDAIRRTIRR